ncbi:zinc finger, C2H2 type [Cooperia oncophora]
MERRNFSTAVVISDFSKRKPAFLTATTRAINLIIGLTEDGNLPVNLEEKRKEALLAKLKSADTSFASSTSSSPSCSQIGSSLPKEKEQSARCMDSPPVVILDASPPSVQMIEYPEPPSVQVIESGSQISPTCVQQTPVELPAQPTEELGRKTQAESHARSMRTDMVSMAEADLIDEIDGLVESSSVTCDDEVASSSQEKDSNVSNSENGVTNDFAENNAARTSVIISGRPSTEVLKEQLQCELCCLTMRSHADLELHLKWHTEFPSLCYLCEPALGGLEKPEQLLEHVKANHTLPAESPKQDGIPYVVCVFCNFQVRSSSFMAHLVSDCYMAPCPLCGDKLVRRNDRVNHKKAHKKVSERFLCECRRGYATITAFKEHICRSKSVPVVNCTCCDAKFSAAQIGQAKAMKDGVLHFIKKHTKNLYCFPCKNEPLEALTEHARSHLKEESEMWTPKPCLHSCSEMGLLNNSIEYPQFPLQSKKRNKSSPGATVQDQPDNTEAKESSSSSQLPAPSEEVSGEEEMTEHSAWDGDDLHQSESSNSRDGNSPSLLEKQRQVLANLIDDLGPPPSVIVIENGTASVREEKEEEPSAVPKSSVADDRRMSSSSTASPVVHYVNEGDDDCMMLDVLELPTGITSQSVTNQREKKFKCSMCSEMFLRQSTCQYHEQTSHRNDIISDICDEVPSFHFS